jgi:hypothetical protein
VCHETAARWIGRRFLLADADILQVKALADHIG